MRRGRGRSHAGRIAAARAAIALDAQPARLLETPRMVRDGLRVQAQVGCDLRELHAGPSRRERQDLLAGFVREDLWSFEPSEERRYRYDGHH
jgi:hypothetical protein